MFDLPFIQWPGGRGKVWVSGDNGQRLRRSRLSAWNWNFKRPNTFLDPDARNWQRHYVLAKRRSRSGSRIGELKTNASKRPTSTTISGKLMHRDRWASLPDPCWAIPLKSGSECRDTMCWETVFNFLSSVKKKHFKRFPVCIKCKTGD